MVHYESIMKQFAYRTCDFCSKRLENYKTCPGCGKDLCNQCGHWWDIDPWTQENASDYPELACERCHNLVREMVPKVIATLAAAEEQIRSMQKLWKEQCLLARAAEKTVEP